MLNELDSYDYPNQKSISFLTKAQKVEVPEKLNDVYALCPRESSILASNSSTE